MDDIKTKMLGEIEKGRIEASAVPLEADIEALLSPMEKPTSIMKLFCCGCGVVYEIDKEGAAKLAEIAKVELPANTSGRFFKSNGCLACNGPGDKITLEETRVS
jgi:hypothetical protein